jgi:hypothetical protein
MQPNFRPVRNSRACQKIPADWPCYQQPVLRIHDLLVWIRIRIQEAKNIRYGSDGSRSATLLATTNFVDVPAELDAEGLDLDEELPHIDNLVPN